LAGITLAVISNTGCKRLLEIKPPYNSITTSQVFGDSADAVSALAGIYSNRINTGPSRTFGSNGTTIIAGLSADELVSFDNSDPAIQEFNSNTLETSNPDVNTFFWAPLYSLIYQCNAIIESTGASTNISNTAKSEIVGEAKFLRAYSYFYLTNLFGNVPLIISTGYKANQLASSAPVKAVYTQIINDLKDAQALLPTDYSAGKGEKIRPNKWAATAMLARAYLFSSDWQNAETQASAVVNANTFRLTSLDSVFLMNSDEAIFQLQINSSINTGTYNATPEGYIFIPFDTTYPPSFYLDTTLLNDFEANDQRRVSWVDSTSYYGTVYYYPYKYKIGSGQSAANAQVSEYYMVMRYAELYLIRAEAKAKLNTDLPGAIADINMIRSRAGLGDLPTSLTQSQVLDAILQEKRIEFFSEWGHRWLDLKRTGLATTILSPIKPQWQPYQQLYPVPITELSSDPNLKQNPGYY